MVNRHKNNQINPPSGTGIRLSSSRGGFSVFCYTHSMQNITPFLWFDQNAEEAANFYVSVFKNSKILNMSRYPKEGQEVTGMPEGKVMVVEFELDGLKF